MIIKHPTRNGLVAEYLFRGNAQDTSGNGRHLNVVSAPLTTDHNGRANSAYAFDGTGRMAVQNIPAIAATDLHSVRIVFKTGIDITTPQSLFTYRSATESRKNMFIAESKLCWNIYDGASYNKKTIDILAETVYDLVFLNFSHSSKQIYNNAVESGYATAPTIMAAGNDGWFIIGSRAPAVQTDSLLGGWVSSCQIYLGILNVSEIQQLHNYWLSH